MCRFVRSFVRFVSFRFVSFRFVPFRSVVPRRQTSTLSLMPLPLTRVMFAITLSSSSPSSCPSSFPPIRSIQPSFPPHLPKIHSSFLSSFFSSFFFISHLDEMREREREREREKEKEQQNTGLCENVVRYATNRQLVRRRDSFYKAFPLSLKRVRAYRRTYLVSILGANGRVEMAEHAQAGYLAFSRLLTISLRRVFSRDIEAKDARRREFVSRNSHGVHTGSEIRQDVALCFLFFFSLSPFFSSFFTGGFGGEGTIGIKIS